MEIWDAYLEDGTPAGVDLVRDEPIPKGLYHIVCEMLVRHADGDYLLMQRDLAKPAYPGYWEASAGGSALKGETPDVCARRELREETGITDGVFEPLGVHKTGETFFHNYLCITHCDKSAVTLQEGETVAFKWLNEQDFIAFVNSDEGIDWQKGHYRELFAKLGYIR